MAIKGDFISFTYNGVHSTELGIVHVSASNRYTDALLPTIQDKTVQAAGSNGTYFFGSYYTQRQISLNIAYDEVSESQLRLIRKVLGDQLSHPLIFDEEPYKVYYAKVTGTPQYTYIPFSTPRVYKGEGTLTFTCYEPFAHTLNNQKYLSQFPGYTEDKELSGSLVSFNDGIGNLKKLEVKFNASQNLNGYTKPWPAAAGDNKWEPQGGTHNGVTFTPQDDGTVKLTGRAINATWTYVYQFVALPYHGINAGDTVTLWSDTYGVVMCYAGDANILVKSSINSSATTFTIPANATKIRMQQCGKSTVPEAGEDFDAIVKYFLAKAESFSAWTPYSNMCPITGLTGLSAYVSPTQDQQDATTYAEDWTSQAGTVYGGMVEITEGNLESTYNMVDLGTLDWRKYDVAQGTLFRTTINDSVYQNSNVKSNALCSAYPTVAQANKTEGTLSASNHSFDIIDSRYTDAADFKAAMLGIQLVYELATPLIYQLTAQEVSVLEGQNNIWSSSGNVTLIYNELTGKIEDWKLEWNPSANLLDEQGSYDIYNNTTGFKLYNPGDLEADFKLIIPIPSGDGASFSISGIKVINTITLESKILNTSAINSEKAGDVAIQFNSKTNLIEGLDAYGARTGNLYNEYITSGDWFKIPITTDGNWQFQLITYNNTSLSSPTLEYDYLYF